MIGQSLEDFLESVYAIGKDDWADIEAVASRIGIKVSSAYVSAGKLSNIELLKGKDHMKKVKLTETGLKVARQVQKKHQAIKQFFSDFLCVHPDVAEMDVHHIEHVITDESLNKIIKFLEYVEHPPEEYKKWLEEFRGKVCQV